MNLVIVESPTKSKTIEKFLGKNYVVRASMGHLRDLPKSTIGVSLPDDEESKKLPEPDYSFTPKYINIRGKGDLIKELKAQAKKADKVYLATDPDREGEAISWHLAHILDIPENEKCRIEFHEITKTAVNDAIKHVRAIDMDMVDAQQTRRILDRVVGYKLSPLLWRKMWKGLSAGRVQSVAVKIVADRDKEIESFIPEEYWTLKAKLREDSKAPIFEADAVKYRGKKLEMHNADEAAKAEQDLQKADYVVSEAVRKDRKRHPVPPFTTSSLQQEANRKLNFSAKKTMMVAQQLYEGVSLGRSAVGLITYMRTDSVRLADEAVYAIREYIEGTYGPAYRPEKRNYFATKKNAQDAHEAIRPTSVLRTPTEVARYLTRDQLRLYTLIWNRAVGSQMSDAVYDATTLTIDAGEYQLKASGSILKFPGFLVLNEKGAEDEKDKTVPYLPVGTKLLLHKLLPAEQHFTEPPAHFTEATLVKELEEKGIGRPSTYATTIQTNLDRGYIVKEQKKLLVTELGLKVVDMLTTFFTNLIDVPFSASLELELDEIAEQKVDKNKVLKDFYIPFQKDLEKADALIPKEAKPVEVSDVICEKCGRNMVVKMTKKGEKFLACPGFPDCRNTKSIIKKIGISCPKCGADIIERKTKTGKVFYGCEAYPACDYTSWDKPIEKKCEKCGANMVEHIERNGRKNLYCGNPECADSRDARLAAMKARNEARKAAAAEKATTTKKATTAKKVTAKKTTTKTAAKKTTTKTTRKTTTRTTTKKAAE